MKGNHLAAFALAALGWGGGPLLGQRTQNASAEPKRVAGFVVARYVEDGTRSIYAAQRVGPVMLLGGLVRNVRTDLTTAVVGFGDMPAARGPFSLSTFVAGARNSDGTSLRVYLSPTARLGLLTANATIGAFQPLGNSKAVAQASVNPLTLALRVTPRIKAGVATIADFAEGRDVKTSGGPYATVRVPGGVASVEWMTWHHHARRELRWGFSSTY